MIYWLTTNLWTTGQGIVTRRLMPRPVAPPKRSSRTPPKEAEVSSERRDVERRPGSDRHRPRVARRAASSGSAGDARGDERVERHHRRGDGRDRRRGEVGGAPRARVARTRASIASSVQFQVVSEGERGLLGVGFTPAHVIASAEAGRERVTTAVDGDTAVRCASRDRRANRRGHRRRRLDLCSRARRRRDGDAAPARMSRCSSASTGRRSTRSSTSRTR